MIINNEILQNIVNYLNYNEKTQIDKDTLYHFKNYQ